MATCSAGSGQLRCAYRIKTPDALCISVMPNVPVN